LGFTLNFFDLFSFSPSFEVGLRELDARYRELCQQHHPDKLGGADSKQRIQALETTAQLNQGYKTLRDPALRAAYLLKLLGVDIDEEGERTFQMDPKFLLEILDLREQLDAARQKGDVSQALEMGKQMAAREKQTHELLSKLFAEQQQNPDSERLKKLADQVAALRYFRRFQDEVSQIEEASL
jgi:molecular chaperone HscB